jgi:hypothetical protein
MDNNAGGLIFSALQRASEFADKGKDVNPKPVETGFENDHARPPGRKTPGLVTLPGKPRERG